MPRSRNPKNGLGGRDRTNEQDALQRCKNEVDESYGNVNDDEIHCEVRNDELVGVLKMGRTGTMSKMSNNDDGILRFLCAWEFGGRSG